MDSFATIVAERVRAASGTMQEIAQVAAGLSIVGFVFMVAQALLFLEELLWRA